MPILVYVLKTAEMIYRMNIFDMTQAHPLFKHKSI